jgi:repressor LexA
LDGGYVTAAETTADFCLTAKGDSMIGARIYDGDEVFIQQTDMVNNGEIAAVVVDNEATLKRVYYYPEDEKLILTAENPAFAPMVFVGEELADIRILGRAVAFQSKVR